MVLSRRGHSHPSPQARRTRTADEFRKATDAVLFSSDVSARGMDYPDVTAVVQVPCPPPPPPHPHPHLPTPPTSHLPTHLIGTMRLTGSLTPPPRPSPSAAAPTPVSLTLGFGACVQVGMASDKAQYIHRLGRTARAGKGGGGYLVRPHVTIAPPPMGDVGSPRPPQPRPAAQSACDPHTHARSFSRISRRPSSRCSTAYP